MQTPAKPAAELAAQAEPTWEIAYLFPFQGGWSEEEYLALDTNRLVEFSHGRVEVLPMPTDKHQSIVFLLSVLLADLARRTGGKALFAPMRLRLGPEKVREPDLLFLSAADDARRQDAFWTGADLVIEVVSPDDPQRDWVTKRAEYAQAGIPEYWIVDPQREEIAVLRLEGDAYQEHGRFGRGTVATSANFDLQAAVDDVLDAD